MTNKLVYVIILGWNHLEDLKETVLSFKKQDYSNFKIVLSDNCSTDNSVSWIKTEHPEIIVLENTANLGWAGGNNVGINYALNNGADYILLANNDLYFDETSIISTLVSDLERLREKKVSIIGTNVYHYHPKEKLHNAGWTTEIKGKPFNLTRTMFNPGIQDYYKVVDYVSGCFILIDALLFKKNGLFDEAFFMYGEESDFSFRAWENGYASIINTKLSIYHKISVSAKNNSPLMVFLKTRNLIYFYNKHKKNIKHFYFYKFQYYKYFLKKIVSAVLFPSKFYGSYFQIIKALILGYIHGHIKLMGIPKRFIK